MKNAIFVLVLNMFISPPQYGQTSLDIKVSRCQQDIGYNRLNYCKIFKNEKLIDLYKLNHSSLLTIDNLEPGVYEIEFYTLFRELYIQTFSIIEGQKNEVEICIDKLCDYAYGQDLIFDQLKNGENYIIRVLSRGCFHSKSNSMEIFKHNDKHFIVYNGKERELGEEELDLIRNFELELDQLPIAWCTTEDTYIIQYSGEYYKTLDTTCSWHGFKNLIRNLESNEKTIIKKAMSRF